MANVIFRGVSKHFGNVRAVDDVSFGIEAGEFICLLGPSGCGKTTTLRLLAGLEQATSGRIFINDTDVTEAKPKERDIGMVFQDYALFPHMTISENIAYPLRVRGSNLTERQERARQVARSLQIEALLERRPGQISGGQQQRTSVARAVVHRPQLFLFDEPLSNLDAKLRLEARSFLKHLQREVGVTSVYVTHDQAEAMALADRIAVMDNGKIVQIAAPLEVYRRPATTFVANFLGSPPMNLLQAVVSRSELRGEGFTLPTGVLGGREQHLSEGAAVTLGIRPEHMRLATNGAPGSISGSVYAVEPLGPESLVILKVGETLITARLFGDEPPELSGRVSLDFDSAQVHLFDAAGQRL